MSGILTYRRYIPKSNRYANTRSFFVLKTWFWYYILYFVWRLKVKLWTVSLYKEICNDFEILQGAIWHVKSRPNQIGHSPRNTLFSPYPFILFCLLNDLFLKDMLTKYIGTCSVLYVIKKNFQVQLKCFINLVWNGHHKIRFVENFLKVYSKLIFLFVLNHTLEYFND